MNCTQAHSPSPTTQLASLLATAILRLAARDQLESENSQNDSRTGSQLA